MKFNRRPPFLAIAALVLWMLPAAALAADVEVFAEGAYTATNLDVYIYANINTGNLCSYGVKLSYDPRKLSAPLTAAKNANIWYFGTKTAKQPYMNPDTSTPGQIIFIGGKMDTGNPQAGVTGSRVLLGRATFTRTESKLKLGITAQDYFGVTLSLGKTGNFNNFVTTAGVVKDNGGVAFSAVVRERGDANANGVIDTGDIFVVKTNMQSGQYSVTADCNDNGLMDTGDMFCIKNKM